ncbi:hypothetical protein J4711_13685 [Staphylococcus epidermidis]|nr:hypothetical protein [Staphylococcus epidermidis]
MVFSELSLCGYYPGDMLDEPSFLQRLDEGLQDLLAATRQYPDLHCTVGAHAPQRAGQTAAQQPAGAERRPDSPAVRQAVAAHLQHFDERRHFEPGADGQGAAHWQLPGGLSGLRRRLE